MSYAHQSGATDEEFPESSVTEHESGVDTDTAAADEATPTAKEHVNVTQPVVAAPAAAAAVPVSVPPPAPAAAPASAPVAAAPVKKATAAEKSVQLVQAVEDEVC